MVDGQAISISSIEEAISYLLGEFEDIENKEVEFSDWPNIDIKIHGSKYNGEITPELAKGIYDFSVCLRKAYASYRYGGPDLRGCRGREDQEIFDSFLFTIGEGCTGISAWLGKAATKALTDLGKGAISNMNSRDIRIVSVILIMALFGGYTVNQVKSMIEDSHQKDAIVSAIAENKKTAVGVLENIPEVQLAKMRAAEKQVSEGHEKIIRAAPDAEKIEIGHKSYNKEDIQRITSGEERITNSKEIKDDLVLIGGISKSPDNLGVIVKVHSEIFPDKVITLKYDRGFLDTVSESNLYKALQRSPMAKVKINYHAIFNEDNNDFLRGSLTSVGNVEGIKPISDPNED